MQNPDHLIDVAAAAAILTLKPSTVRALVQDGKLPAVRPAGVRRVRFRLHDIERLAGLRPHESGVASAADSEKRP